MPPPQIIPYPEHIDYTKLGVEVPNTRKAGQTGHWRNAFWPELITPANQPIKTLLDVWESGLSKDPNAPCLGRRPLVSTSPLKYADHYVWETYAQVDERRRNLGSTIHHWFSTGRLTKTETGLETVGIWSINRPEWQIIDLALHAYGKVGVSLYDTLGPEAVEYIINHAAISVVFVTPEKIPNLLRISKNIPSLRVIVSIDSLSASTKPLLQQWAKEKDIEVFDLLEWEEFGRVHPVEPLPATPDQLASICYTSGTTGFPKGVLLTHGNLSIVAASNLHGVNFPDRGILMSYLPLAHIYERFAEHLAFALGGRVGYFTGDPLRLLEDAQVLKPHYFPSVPRVLNRVYGTAAATLAAGGLKATLLRKAMDTKLAELHKTGLNTHAFWDRLVFKKIQAALGGQVVLITSGSAPISQEVIDFLKIAFACEVIEGIYGMTENAATCLRNLPYDAKAAGTVGPPQPVNEVKLIDVPEMGYTSQDKPYPRGELCVRGANNFIGYYKDPENTKKTIDAEGWIHTGDVASIDTVGRVSIIDRVKNIMKLSQGEYVALEKIENTYSTTPLLASIFVYGNSLRDHLVAVAVLDPAGLATLGVKLGITSKLVDPTDLVGLDKILADERVNQEVMKSMNEEAKKRGLKGFEQVKAVHLTNEIWTADNGLLTPSFKIKRKEMEAKYKTELEALYGGSSVASSVRSGSSVKSSL